MLRLFICLSLLIELVFNVYAIQDSEDIKYQLLNSIEKCDITNIQKIVNSNTLELLDKTGNSVTNIPASLYYSCNPNDFCRILPLFVKHGFDVNKRIDSGETLLHNAVRESNKIAAICLLANGADPKISLKEGKRRIYSPAQLAKKLRKREIYALLTENEDNSSSIEKSLEKDNLNGFKIHFQKGENRTSKNKLLVEAAKNGSLKIAEFLLEQGANPNFVEENGYSAYFYAVSYADVSMLGTLMDYKLKINDQNSNNNGPIAWLFKSHQPVSLADQGIIAKLMIDNGLDKKACKKGFQYYKNRYGVYTKEDAIGHDRHLGGSHYVYVYDMLDNCKAP